MKKITILVAALYILAAANNSTHAQTDWHITGNAGTNSGTNFIGTTDNVNFKIRTKNNLRMTITSGGKVAIGSALPAFKLDVQGGSINTDSVYRIGGNTVLSVNGVNNIFVGEGSGISNTTGNDNTANGFRTLYSNTEGDLNTAIGNYALTANTTGNFNTASGFQALSFNTTGSNNTAFGVVALYANTTGSNNAANGFYALAFNTTGNFNTANGSGSLNSNTTGNNNTANGYQSLFSNTNGISNTANGNLSLYSNTLGGLNTASGSLSLYTNTTGSDNTANGFQALNSNTNGNKNTASGNYSLRSNSSGSNNTSSGYNSLYSNTSGLSNTATGYMALYYNTTGINNTAVGRDAGCNFGTTPINFTALGYNAGHVASNTNSIEIGNTSVTSIAGQVGWSTYSDKRIKDNIQSNVPGLSFITRLNPVTYNLNIHRENEICGINDTNEWEGKYDLEKITQTGFLAQEVEQAAKECNYDFNGVKAPTGNAKLYSIQYAAFVMPLVKAVQELNEELKSEVRSQKSENEKLKSEIEIIKSVLSSEQKQKFDEIKNENEVILQQNSPNPFTTQTEIKFHLPRKFNSAQLIISNADGKQVRSYSLEPSVPVIIKGSELAAGTYIYTLLIDGIITDTKQMVLTK